MTGAERHAAGRPTRVLMTTDALGGVWTYACELAGALALDGVTTALAVLGGRPSGAQRAQARRVPGLQLFESDFRLEWMDEPWDDVARAGEWLLELESKVRPDIVHLNGYSLGSLPWKAPRLVVGHSCVLSWWRAVEREEAPSRYDRYREAAREGLRSADAVVAPTAAFGRCIEEHYGPLDDVRVIPNGRCPTLFPCGRKDECILAAGRLWDAAKNLAALERVAPALPWRVYAAGDERSPGSNRELRGLGRLSVERLAEWYRRAAIFAHPARYEPFGLAPLEAGLAGCALVLGDIPTLREVWRNAALYVDPDDEAQLRETLVGLIRYPGRRRRMAARARRQALRYTPTAMAAGYRHLYGELLGVHPRLRARPLRPAAPATPGSPAPALRRSRERGAEGASV